MRRLLAVPAVASVAVAVVAGCSSFSSPSPSSSSRSSASPSSPMSQSSPASPSSAESPSSSASSSAKQTDEPLPDPAALLKESSTTTKDLKSVHLVQSVDGKIAEVPFKKLEADLTREPSTAAKGSAKITVMGADVGIGFVEFGHRLYAALPGAGWRDFGRTSEVYDVAAILNPDTGLTNMLADFIDPSVEERETVDEQQTVRIAGKVPADTVNKVVPLEASKRMMVTVWIQESGDHQLVKTKLEPGKDSSIEMGLSKWNAPVIVDKPAGA